MGNPFSNFVEQTCATDYHTVFRCAEEGQISGFDPLPRKIGCRSARKKVQIQKMSTSRRRYVEIPGNSVSGEGRGGLRKILPISEPILSYGLGRICAYVDCPHCDM